MRTFRHKEVPGESVVKLSLAFAVREWLTVRDARQSPPRETRGVEARGTRQSGEAFAVLGRHDRAAFRRHPSAILARGSNRMVAARARVLVNLALYIGQGNVCSLSVSHRLQEQRNA